MISIAVNPPKTPVTEGSNGLAPASLPNVCKMPGPPAPFVPTPLPNIGRSGDNLSKGTKKVLFEGKKVAIKGSSFKSVGDIASKGTGGGIISAQTHGKTEWIAPGSIETKAEGKNIQLLGDAMTNNGGSPANAGTPSGEVQAPKNVVDKLKEIACKCNKKAGNKRTDTCAKQGTKKHACCDKEIEKHMKSGEDPQLGGERGYDSTGNRMNMTRQQAYDSGQLGGTCWPDACTVDANGNPTQLFDFKFKCPPGSKTRKKKKGGRYWTRATGVSGYPTWSNGQEKKCKKLGRQLGIDNKQNPPQIIDTSDCP